MKQRHQQERTMLENNHTKEKYADALGAEAVDSGLAESLFNKHQAESEQLAKRHAQERNELGRRRYNEDKKAINIRNQFKNNPELEQKYQQKLEELKKTSNDERKINLSSGTPEERYKKRFTKFDNKYKQDIATMKQRHANESEQLQQKHADEIQTAKDL